MQIPQREHEFNWRSVMPEYCSPAVAPHLRKNINATSVGICIYLENGKLTKNAQSEKEYAHHIGNSMASTGKPDNQLPTVPVKKFVITSYSIHYTKLYDNSDTYLLYSAYNVIFHIFYFFIATKTLKH